MGFLSNKAQQFRRSFRYLVLLASVFVASKVIGGDRESNAAELVKLQGFETQVREAQEICLRSVANIDMTEKFRTDPARFGGVGPESNKWAEAKLIYASYLSAVCLEPTTTVQVNILKSAYADGLSEDHLRQVIKFYGSPAGRQLSKASSAANRQLAGLQNAAFSPAFIAAYRRYESDLAALKRQAEIKP